LFISFLEEDKINGQAETKDKGDEDEERESKRNK